VQLLTDTHILLWPDERPRLIVAQAHLEGMVLGTHATDAALWGDDARPRLNNPLASAGGERQYTAPLAVIGQTCSTRLPRMPTYQS
jgi:hypothetical protein